MMMKTGKTTNLNKGLDFRELEEAGLGCTTFTTQKEQSTQRLNLQCKFNCWALMAMI